MPNKTNQERIIDNNDKIDEIKSKVSDLPDYQDIQPVYGNKLYNCEVVDKIAGTGSTVYAMTFDTDLEPELGLVVSTTGASFYKMGKNQEGEYVNKSLINSFTLDEFPIQPAVEGSTLSIAKYMLSNPYIDNPYVVVVTSNSVTSGSSRTNYIRFNVIPYVYQNGVITVDAGSAMTYLYTESGGRILATNYPIIISDDGKFFRFGSYNRSLNDAFYQYIGTINWETHTLAINAYTNSWSGCEAYFVNNNTLIEYYTGPQGYTLPEFKCSIILRILRTTGSTLMLKTFSNGAIAITSDLKYVLYKDSSTAGTNAFHFNTINIDYENNTITETLYKSFILPDTDNNVLIHYNVASNGYPIVTLGDNILAICGATVSGDSNTYLETYKLDFSQDVPLLYEDKIVIGSFAPYIYKCTVMYTYNKVVKGVPEYAYIQGLNYSGKYFYKYIEDGIASANAEDVLLGKTYVGAEGKTLNGTMPNNGVLNYAPSTAQQTIPAGYTSGGTISAVTSAIDNNIQANNIKKDVEILGVTGTYEGSGGGSGDVKLFDTVEHMQQDADAQEGDLAVVYRNGGIPYDGMSEVTQLYFPQTVTLSEPFTASMSAWGDIAMDIYINAECAEFMIENWDTDLNVYIQYSSIDGLTYDRTDSEGDIITLSDTPVNLGIEDWDLSLGNFIQTMGEIFEGFYKYDTNQYVVSAPNLTLNNANQLLTGYSAFGKDGVVAGDGSVYDNLNGKEVLQHFYNVSDVNNQIIDVYGLRPTSSLVGKLSYYKFDNNGSCAYNKYRIYNECRVQLTDDLYMQYTGAGYDLVIYNKNNPDTPVWDYHNIRPSTSYHTEHFKLYNNKLLFFEYASTFSQNIYATVLDLATLTYSRKITSTPLGGSGTASNSQYIVGDYMVIQRTKYGGTSGGNQVVMAGYNYVDGTSFTWSKTDIYSSSYSMAQPYVHFNLVNSTYYLTVTVKSSSAWYGYVYSLDSNGTSFTQLASKNDLLGKVYYLQGDIYLCGSYYNAVALNKLVGNTLTSCTITNDDHMKLYRSNVMDDNRLAEVNPPTVATNYTPYISVYSVNINGTTVTLTEDERIDYNYYYYTPDKSMEGNTNTPKILSINNGKIIGTNCVEYMGICQYNTFELYRCNVEQNIDNADLIILTYHYSTNGANVGAVTISKNT